MQTNLWVSWDPGFGNRMVLSTHDLLSRSVYLYGLLF